MCDVMCALEARFNQDKDLVGELVQVAEDNMLREEQAVDPPELSGKLMSALKAAGYTISVLLLFS